MFNIKDITIPTTNGVYIMYDKNDNIIYVGKAKNIKKRIKQYFTSIDKKDLKTKTLVHNIANISFINCNTEVEALILENNLIKKHSPKYNILLKDQKTYPYIKITNEKIAKISKVRKVVKSNDTYYGPYPNLNVDEAIKTLIKVFMIRDCNVNVYKENERACLKYHLKLCNAPCVYKDENTMREYTENVNLLKDFLNNKSNKVVKLIENRMLEYSKNEEFELAIREREKLKILNKLIENQYIDQKNTLNEDVFVFKEIDNKVFVCVVSVRNGILISKNSFIVNTYVKDTNLVQDLVYKYYVNSYIPKNIILDINYYTDKEYSYLEDKKILEDSIELIDNKKVNLIFPKINSKNMKLLELANLNLKSDIDEYMNKKINIYNGLKKLQKVLNLKTFPKRIDCFDISNTQGSEPVASMTVAINGITTNKHYRLFNIRCKDTPDDFLMLKEAVIRRYSDVSEEEIPNLILIDGGKGQLSSVYNVLKEFKHLENTDIISIAKREEEIFKDIEKEPYIFSKNDEALKILQRLRDEAHRFGITNHRKRRSKRVISGNLDDIYGVGKIIKKKLIDRFKTFKNIENASLEELNEVISLELAYRIKEYFESRKKNEE